MFASLRVSGVDELVRAAERAPAEIERMGRDVAEEAADLVARRARSLVPRLRGAAAASVRVTKDADGAGITAGAGLEYFGWLDFGGAVGIRGSVRRPWRSGGRYVWPAAKASEARITREAEDGANDLIRKIGL